MGLDLYPTVLHEEDLSPDAFGSDIDAICEEVKAATEGFGTDEDRLLIAMGSQPPETRCKVGLRYKELYDQDLVELMKSECGRRPFGQALQFLATDPLTAECMMLNKACKGVGTNELLLLTILCGRTNKEMELLKKAYFKTYDADLGRLLDSELSGDLEKLVFNVLQAAEEEYDPEVHNEEKMKEDVEQLYEMGQGRLGTNEAGLFKLLCASPPEYLKELNLKYADKYGVTLSKMCESELKGYTETAATLMLGMKIKPHESVAQLIDKACKGWGTNELLLTTVLIRYQSILPDVFAAHEELFGQTVPDRVKSETGGDYESLLTTILNTAVE